MHSNPYNSVCLYLCNFHDQFLFEFGYHVKVKMVFETGSLKTTLKEFDVMQLNGKRCTARFRDVRAANEEGL